MGPYKVGGAGRAMAQSLQGWWGIWLMAMWFEAVDGSESRYPDMW